MQKSPAKASLDTDSPGISAVVSRFRREVEGAVPYRESPVLP